MLILDEPTNFLDIKTLEALEMFMNKYPQSFCLHHMIQGLLNMYQIKMGINRTMYS